MTTSGGNRNPENADNEAVEGVVDIPADALLGHTRMRVIMRYNEAPGSPCDGFDYGEVEDYCITLIPNTGQGLHEASGGLVRDALRLWASSRRGPSMEKMSVIMR